MKHEPLVSVILPVYNAEAFLDEAIESILNQTLKDFELIIINDGSIDKSLKIIEKYKSIDKRIVLITRENRGLVYSLNEGIESAQGKYIARMDADDISAPNRLETQLNIFFKLPNIEVVGCDYQHIDENGNKQKIVKVPKKIDDILLSLCYSVPFAHPSVMMKKSIFNKFKYEDCPTEDYLLWSKIYNHKNNNFYNIDDVLLYYRYHYGKSFSDSKRLKMLNSEREIASKFIIQHQYELISIFKKNTFTKTYASKALISILLNKNHTLFLQLFISKPSILTNLIYHSARHFLRTLFWTIKG